MAAPQVVSAEATASAFEDLLAGLRREHEVIRKRYESLHHDHTQLRLLMLKQFNRDNHDKTSTAHVHSRITPESSCDSAIPPAHAGGHDSKFSQALPPSKQRENEHSSTQVQEKAPQRECLNSDSASEASMSWMSDILVNTDSCPSQNSSDESLKFATKDSLQSCNSMDDVDEWKQQLVSIFNELDADGNGSLSTDELRVALTAADVPRARLTRIIAMADRDRSGCVDLSEWMNATDHCGEEELRQMVSVLARKQSSGSMLDLHQQQLPDCCMIRPISGFRATFDSIIAIMCIYIGCALPFFVAWDHLLSESLLAGFAFFDRCVNGIFMLDILINFRTGYYDRDGFLIMSQRKVAKQYLSTWFALDFVSSFPFDEVTLDQRASNLQALKVLKISKLLKVLKLLKPRNIDFENVNDRLDDFFQSKFMVTVYRRANVFIKMLLLCHWLACGMKIVDEGFLEGYQNVRGRVSSEYLAALYWSMTTLTTVGYGDIIPSSDRERAYTTAAMVLGGVFYGYVVGSITSTVSRYDLNTSAYYERMDLIYAWITHHSFPKEMKRHLRRYFKTYLSEKAALSEAEVWQDLTPEMQREVGEYMLHEDVRKNPVFDGVSVSCVVRLQAILRQFTVPAGRVLATKGEVGTAMYICHSGRLEMTLYESWETRPDDAPGDVMLGPGQSFGEEVLLGLIENFEYTVRSTEKAKVSMILECDFLDLFQSSKNELQRMIQNIVSLHPRQHLLKRLSTLHLTSPSATSDSPHFHSMHNLDKLSFVEAKSPCISGSSCLSPTRHVHQHLEHHQHDQHHHTPRKMVSFLGDDEVVRVETMDNDPSLLSQDSSTSIGSPPQEVSMSQTAVTGTQPLSQVYL